MFQFPLSDSFAGLKTFRFYFSYSAIHGANRPTSAIIEPIAIIAKSIATPVRVVSRASQ
jgi:hypothetical protein